MCSWFSREEELRLILVRPECFVSSRRRIRQSLLYFTYFRLHNFLSHFIVVLLGFLHILAEGCDAVVVFLVEIEELNRVVFGVKELRRRRRRRKERRMERRRKRRENGWFRILRIAHTLRSWYHSKLILLTLGTTYSYVLFIFFIHIFYIHCLLIN